MGKNYVTMVIPTKILSNCQFKYFRYDENQGRQNNLKNGTLLQ